RHAPHPRLNRHRSSWWAPGSSRLSGDAENKLSAGLRFPDPPAASSSRLHRHEEGVLSCYDCFMQGNDQIARLEHTREQYDRLIAEVHRVIIGQDDVVKHLVGAMLARGHCLLIGVPGLAKTLLVKTLAQCLSWDFKRI